MDGSVQLQRSGQIRTFDRQERCAAGIAQRLTLGCYVCWCACVMSVCACVKEKYRNAIALKHFRFASSDFLFYLSTPKVANTNPNCVLKTDIICDRAPPTVTFTLIPAVQGTTKAARPFHPYNTNHPGFRLYIRRVRPAQAGEARREQSEHVRTGAAVQQVRVGAGAQGGPGEHIENEIGEEGQRCEGRQETLGAQSSFASSVLV